MYPEWTVDWTFPPPFFPAESRNERPVPPDSLPRSNHAPATGASWVPEVTHRVHRS